MPNQKPHYQVKIARWTIIGSILLAVLNFATTTLDWFNQSLTLVSVKVASAGTLLILTVFLFAQLFLKKWGINWMTDNGRIIRLRRLGKIYTNSTIGIILLLWIGPIAASIKNRPTCHPATENQILILIPKFQLAENVPDSEAYNKIKASIEKTTSELDLTNIKVEIEKNIKLADNDFNKARTLGEKCNATIVIWGTETHVDLTINFYNLKAKRTSAAQSSINELALPDDYPKLIVQYIPSRINFLALLTIGDILQTEGKSDQALDVVHSAITNIEDVKISSKEKSSIAEAYFRLGSLYSDKKEYEMSIDAYSTSIGIDPTARTFNNRGTSRMNLKDYDGAIKDFDKAIELDSNYPLPLSNRGNAHLMKQDFDEALKDYDKAIEVWPEYSHAYAMRGQLHYLKSEYEMAIKDITESIELDPNDNMIYLLRAAAYIEVNSYDLALIDCNTSIEIAPLDGNAYYLRSIIYEALGEYDKSSVDMQIANKLGYSEENIYNQEVGP